MKVFALLVSLGAVSFAADWPQLIDRATDLVRAGEYVVAESVAREALAAAMSSDPDHCRIPRSLNVLAVVREYRGDYPGSAKLLAEAARLLQAETGREHQLLLAGVLNNLATASLHQQAYPAALQHTEKALKIVLRWKPADHPDLAPIITNQASAYFYLGRIDEAKERYDTALRSLVGSSIQNQLHASRLLLSRAEVQFARRDPEAAYRDLTQALELQERILGQNHPESAEALMNLSRIQLIRKKTASAEEYAARAVTVARQGARGSQILGEALATHREALRANGRKKETRDLDRELSVLGWRENSNHTVSFRDLGRR
jgi:tetratricopeptide (TPR) repeat protein